MGEKMNPMVRDLLVALFRYALGYIGVWMVSRGIITPEQSDAYISEFSVGLAMAAIALGLGLWARFKSRQKLVTALSMPATSENVVKKEVAAGNAPSVLTPAKQIPQS